MVTNDEIKSWAQLVESLNGQIGLPAYAIFDKISEAYKVNSNIIERLGEIMNESTNMSNDEIEAFIKTAEEYCLKY